MTRLAAARAAVSDALDSARDLGDRLALRARWCEHLERQRDQARARLEDAVALVREVTATLQPTSTGVVYRPATDTVDRWRARAERIGAGAPMPPVDTVLADAWDRERRRADAALELVEEMLGRFRPMSGGAGWALFGGSGLAVASTVAGWRSTARDLRAGAVPAPDDTCPACAAPVIAGGSYRYDPDGGLHACAAEPLAPWEVDLVAAARCGASDAPDYGQPPCHLPQVGHGGDHQNVLGYCWATGRPRWDGQATCRSCGHRDRLDAHTCPHAPPLTPEVAEDERARREREAGARERRWVDQGTRVQVMTAFGGHVHATGRVVAYADAPTVVLITDDGERVNWLAHLCREHPAYTPEAVAKRAERDRAWLARHDAECLNGRACVSHALPRRDLIEAADEETPRAEGTGASDPGCSPGRGPTSVDDRTPLGRHVTAQEATPEWASAADWDAALARGAASGFAVDDPAQDPIGAVRVHPDDDLAEPGARRVVRYGVRLADGETNELRDDEVTGWPRQPLADLARVLGHPDAARTCVCCGSRLRDEHHDLDGGPHTCPHGWGADEDASSPVLPPPLERLYELAEQFHDDDPDALAEVRAEWAMAVRDVMTERGRTLDVLAPDVDTAGQALDEVARAALHAARKAAAGAEARYWLRTVRDAPPTIGGLAVMLDMRAATLDPNETAEHVVVGPGGEVRT